MHKQRLHSLLPAIHDNLLWFILGSWQEACLPAIAVAIVAPAAIPAAATTAATGIPAAAVHVCVRYRGGRH